MVGYIINVPVSVCYEPVEAALVFSVDELLVYAFDVMFAFAGDYESQLCSAEVAVLRLGEESLEF